MSKIVINVMTINVFHQDYNQNTNKAWDGLPKKISVDLSKQQPKKKIVVNIPQWEYDATPLTYNVKKK